MVLNKFFFLAVLPLSIIACTKEEPYIIVGREWNPFMQVVADTGSSFSLKDPIVFQLQYGKNFDFTELEYIIYNGSGQSKKEIWKKTVSVHSKLGSYAVLGKSSSGELMPARRLFKIKAPTTIIIEFKTQDSLIATKEIEVH